MLQSLRNIHTKVTYKANFCF